VALAALNALGGATVGMLAGSLLPLALYQARALGGGDVKLLAVTGALLTAGPGIELTLTALLVAASFGVVKLIRMGRLRRALALSANRCKRLVTPGPRAPVEAGATLELRFGPAVFVAACYLAVAHWPRVEADASAPPSAPLPSALRSPAVVSP
jgi:Flp pilus assembly protein protease CpaA